MPAHKKAIASITVPLRGDEMMRRALNDLAAQENTFVADLTANAICIVYGDRLRSLSQSYVASGASQSDQNVTVVCENKKSAA